MNKGDEMSKETTLQTEESLDLSFLVGHKIVSIGDIIELDNGKVYTITSNEGCGGCANGWSEVTGLESLPTDNMVTKVDWIDDDEFGDTYKVFVYFHDDKYEIDADDGWGNGYYGGGFTITVREKEDEPSV